MCACCARCGPNSIRSSKSPRHGTRSGRPRRGVEPFRIFCLGGSTTEFGDSQGRGWPSRLEERLQAKALDRPIEVHNLGRQWYTSLHTVHNYVANLRHNRPDLIIVTHGINDLLLNADFSHLSAGPFRDDYGHFYGPVTRLVASPSLPQLLLGRVRRSIWYYTPPEEVRIGEFPGIEPFRRYLNALIDLARLDGTRVVLMTQPFLAKEPMSDEERAALAMVNFEAVGSGKQWTPYTAVRGMEAYNEAVRQVARDRGVVLVDLESAVPKTLEYFYDDVHYRDKAFDLVADYVAENLSPELLEPREEPTGR